MVLGPPLNKFISCEAGARIMASREAGISLNIFFSDDFFFSVEKGDDIIMLKKKEENPEDINNKKYQVRTYKLTAPQKETILFLGWPFLTANVEAYFTSVCMTMCRCVPFMSKLMSKVKS